MVIGIVVVTIVAFIIVDFLLRYILKKVNESRILKERKKALDIGLRLEVAEEAKSLKRVQLDDCKARILAVDDEPVILDSFRKILVLDGFSVDTVETGPEALLLLKKNNYDFVFTDLKMPGMGGVEVTKAAKHLRPDIDVIIVTGYATVETAVDSMKYGAMDYVQKPFTDEELIEFTNKYLIKRQAKLGQEIKPSINLITQSRRASTSKHEFNVPAGVFISQDHTWSSIEMNGLIKLGVDDFALKLIGEIDDIELPKVGQNIKKGKIVFSVFQGSRKASFLSPISGQVKQVNEHLPDNVDLIRNNPYYHGWICSIEPTNLVADLNLLKIGADAISWYQEEIDKYMKMIEGIKNGQQLNKTVSEGNEETPYISMDDKVWDEFSRLFLHNNM